MRLSGMLFVIALTGCFTIFVSAKCIERDTVRRGPDGDWHIYGEIHNETDIQGVDMLLQGTLLGPSGSVTGTGQARTCPEELSPNSLSVYDIHINDSAGVPQPASHRINVLSGKTLEDELPELDVELTDVYSTLGRATENFQARATITANEAYTGRWGLCVAFYDGAEEVVGLFTYYTGLNAPPAAPAGQPVQLYGDSMNIFDIVPPEIAKVRLLIWLDSAEGPFTSEYQALVTDLIPIEE